MRTFSVVCLFLLFLSFPSFFFFLLSKGDHPQWKEQTHLPYHLQDSFCVILLDSFCWVKFSVNDNIVEAKKILVYVASTNLSPEDEAAVIEVGYHADLPSATEFFRKNPSFVVVHKKTFFFRKTKYPLKLSLDQLFSREWECCLEEQNSKEIPFETIASSTPHSFFYFLQKRGKSTGNFLCIFTATQEKGQIPIHLAVYPQTMCGNIFPNNSMDVYCEPLLKTEGWITQKGGILEICGTGVELEVPPDSLPDNIEQCKMYMMITPSRRVEGEVVSFSSNSSVAVEIFPDDLQLKRPAKLKLPHCLELHKDTEHKVKIFTRVADKEVQAHWNEETRFRYHVDDAFCIIWTYKLCCIKYCVEKERVTGKKIVVYTATRKDIHRNRMANVEVGYYPDMPGGGELLRMNPNLVVGYRRQLHYKETVGSPLELLLDRIVPRKWNCSFPAENYQAIPFGMIAGSIEHSFSYVLQHTDEKAGNPLCKFTAVQKGGNIPVELVVKAFSQEDYLTSKYQQRKAGADPMTSTFQFLSKYLLGKEWKFVGKTLGLEDAELDHIVHDYTGTQERIYEMLVLWKRKHGKEATHAKLIKSLEETGRKDLAESVLNRKDLEDSQENLG